MTVLSRALQIRKGLSNIGRASEITSAFTKYGFGEALQRLGFKKSSEVQEDGSVRFRSAPERLRLLLESLGPTFIKIGQLAAGRPDLFPAEFVLELEKLQDRVEAVPYPQIKSILENNFNNKLENLFASFDPIPLATASIAQVHTARTLDGADVVVKIQKPDVDRILTKDFEILQLSAELAEETIPEIRAFRPTEVVREFKRMILQELDFQREARTIQRYRENFKHSDFLVVPKVYAAYSTARVLTLERIHGFRVTETEQFEKYHIDRKLLLKKGLDHHMESLMVHGLFHADPHAGNMLVLPDGRLALLDFGSVGWLSPRSKATLVNLFLALITEDYEALVDEYLELSPRDGHSHSSGTRENLTREVSLIMAPYFGMPLKEIPAAQLMLEASQVAFRNRIRLPADLIAVFKSNMILEGIGRALDPDFDLLDSAMHFARRTLKEKVQPSHILRSFLRSSKDVQRFIRKGPRLGLEIMRQLEAGQLEVKLKSSEWEKLLQSDINRQKKQSVAILFLGSALLLGFLMNVSTLQHPWMLYFAEILVISSAVYLVFGLIKPNP